MNFREKKSESQHSCLIATARGAEDWRAIRMVASAVFILDLKGKVIISRNYRGDVPMCVQHCPQCARGPDPPWAVSTRRVLGRRGPARSRRACILRLGDMRFEGTGPLMRAPRRRTCAERFAQLMLDDSASAAPPLIVDKGISYAYVKVMMCCFAGGRAGGMITDSACAAVQ